MLPAPPRSVLIAPDEFKGSLAAVDVARAIARGLRRALPEARLYEHPIVDGGHGTVDMALRYGFRAVQRPVLGPEGDPVLARFAIRDDTAVIDMAAAAGLSSTGCPSPESALRSTSYGVGELLGAALDEGLTYIVLGAGGSIATDGGAGALEALGASIVDQAGSPVPRGGQGLTLAYRLDLGALDSRATYQAEIVVACDETALHRGLAGATGVLAARDDGATRAVDILEEGLVRWAEVVRGATGRDLRATPGAGAAGGLAFGLASVLGARISAGIDVPLALSRFDQAVTACDLVVVGEGSLDARSLRGKGPIGVARRAADLGVPSIAVVGRSSISADEAATAGLAGVVALSDFVGEERSITDTAEVIERVLPEVIARRGRRG